MKSDENQPNSIEKTNQFLEFDILELFTQKFPKIQTEDKSQIQQIKKYCLQGLMDIDNGDLKDTVFKIVTEEGSKNQYVQVKLTSLINKTIIQIIDISNTIMFDQ